MLAQTNCKVNRRLVDSVYFIDNFAETKFIIFVENPYLAAVIASDRTYHAVDEKQSGTVFNRKSLLGWLRIAFLKVCQWSDS